MKNRLIKISILFLETVLLYVVLNFNIGCFFKNKLNFNCPGCGLTRAFIAIFNLDFINAFKYNIISIPLFMMIIYFNMLLLYDIIFKQRLFEEKLLKILNHHKLILIILFITFIINNINKI